MAGTYAGIGRGSDRIVPCQEADISLELSSCDRLLRNLEKASAAAHDKKMAETFNALLGFVKFLMKQVQLKKGKKGAQTVLDKVIPLFQTLCTAESCYECARNLDNFVKFSASLEAVIKAFQDLLEQSSKKIPFASKVVRSFQVALLAIPLSIVLVPTLPFLVLAAAVSCTLASKIRKFFAQLSKGAGNYVQGRSSTQLARHKEIKLVFDSLSQLRKNLADKMTVKENQDGSPVTAAQRQEHRAAAQTLLDHSF